MTKVPAQAGIFFEVFLMKIGVISDTHKNLDSARKALENMGPIDMLLHAGDHFRDAQVLAKEIKIPVKAVMGNCDLTAGPPEELFDLDGVKVLLTHGHRYGVKNGLQKLLYRSKELAVQVTVFGHSHVPAEVWVDGILLFNPGSIGSPRGLGSKPTYGIIYINEEKNIQAHIHQLNE